MLLPLRNTLGNAYKHGTDAISPRLFRSRSCASQKSFRRKDGQGPRDGNSPDFRGEKRSNTTHESATDADARLYKKSRGSESKLAYLEHALMENRQGLLVKTQVSAATGKAERDVALGMAKKMRWRRS